jgi:hypothetical protein
VELLDEFVAHGLFTFDAEGLFEGGDVEPAFAFGAFGDEAAAVGDEPVDEVDLCAVGHAFDVVGHGHVARHEEVRFDAGCSGVGSESAGGVSGGGRGEFFQSVVAGHGDGGGHAAGFEAACRVVGFLFEEEVGVAAAGEHGGPAFAEGNGIGGGKDVGVSPHGGWSVGAGLARLAEGRGVVADVERSRAGGADGLRRLRGEVLVAARAFEMSDGGHGFRVQRCEKNHSPLRMCDKQSSCASYSAMYGKHGSC